MVIGPGKVSGFLIDLILLSSSILNKSISAAKLYSRGGRAVTLCMTFVQTKVFRICAGIKYYACRPTGAYRFEPTTHPIPKVKKFIDLFNTYNHDLLSQRLSIGLRRP